MIQPINPRRMRQIKTNITTTIIDGLRLCYTAEPRLLEDLKGMILGEKTQHNGYLLYRIKSVHFDFAYAIKDANREDIGVLYFGQQLDEERQFVWFKVENKVLYDPDRLRAVLQFPESLGYRFDHFTAIDLAKDFSKNITYLILRMLRKPELTVIVNGKAIKDRKEEICHVVCGVSLDRVRKESFYVRQQKAEHDKTKGLCVTSYNKLREIEQEGSKQYILDFYGNPKRLYRLEIHQNSAEIADFCKRQKIAQSVDLLFDKDFLTEMFYYHLGAVLRFTNKRKRIAWHELLGCNDRAI